MMSKQKRRQRQTATCDELVAWKVQATTLLQEVISTEQVSDGDHVWCGVCNGDTVILGCPLSHKPDCLIPKIEAMVKDTAS